MLHQMTLYNGPFEAIQSGHKTIEMRLYDDMYFYYSKENIDKNGVCGIEIVKI